MKWSAPLHSRGLEGQNERGYQHDEADHEGCESPRVCRRLFRQRLTASVNLKLRYSRQSRGRQIVAGSGRHIRRVVKMALQVGWCRPGATALEKLGRKSFLPAISRYLTPRGQIGIVNAGVQREIEELPPEWPSDFRAFHTAHWWRRHWSLPRCVEVECADELTDGRDFWLLWHRITGATNDEYLTTSAGENLGFHRIVARRR